MAFCSCFTRSSTRSEGEPLLTSKELPVWRHPNVSWKDKITTLIMRTPLPRMATLRYPEDLDEIKRCRDEMAKQFSQFYRMIGRLDRWSVRTEFYTRKDGTQGEIRLHQPVGSVDDPPLLYWCHGGGFTVGTIDDANAMALGNALLDRGVPVLLAIVDYRLAPEDPFPAALDDCLDGLLHMVNLGVSSSVHIGGCSSGGNLAGCLLVECAQRGQPLVKSVLLDAPFVDPMCGNPSYEINARFIPDGNWLRWSWDVYLGRSIEDKKNPRQGLEQLRQLLEQSSAEANSDALPLAPPRAPPVLVVTALGDPLHDEGVEYVELLKRCGAEVDHWDARSSHCTWVFNDSACTALVVDRWSQLLGTELLAGQGG